MSYVTYIYIYMCIYMNIQLLILVTYIYIYTIISNHSTSNTITTIHNYINTSDNIPYP